MKKLYLFFIISFFILSANAQNCTQKLNQAEDEYEAGRLIGIPNLVEACLASGSYSHEEEVRVKKLLTLVYIFTDKEAQAEFSLINLLKEEPEHRLDPQVDPAELFFLYNQYRTKPIFRIALRAGVNFSSPNVLGTYGVAQTDLVPAFYNGKTASGAKEYSFPGGTLNADSLENNFVPVNGIGMGFTGELLIERYFGRGIEVGLGPQIRISKYNVDSFINDPDLGISTVNRQMNLRAPLIVRYTLGYDNRDKTILPYVFLGGSFDYLLQGNYSSAVRSVGTTYNLTDGEDFNKSNQVNQINYSLIGGLGIKYRIKTHFLTLEARYDNSLKNYINGDERYTYQETTFDLAFAESDVSLNFVSFTLGYTHSIYSPKKLKDF
jgi:hypothetical protein